MPTKIQFDFSEVMGLYTVVSRVIFSFEPSYSSPLFVPRMLDGSIPGRVRELLPVFDAAGFCKLPPPTSKLIKPPRS